MKKAQKPSGSLKNIKTIDVGTQKIVSPRLCIEIMKKNKKDQIKLICDIGELCGIFSNSSSLEDFLQKIVDMVSAHMSSDVCSIYLYYENTDELVLKATTGLNRDFVDKVKLKASEGLTGLALKTFEPICERQASKNKNFRFFPGLGEEQYESFLAVPIISGKKKIGAIVIQNTEKDFFSDDDVRALSAITSQLANTIETTRFILSLEERHLTPITKQAMIDLKFIKGKVGSSGFALGEAVIVDDDMSLRKTYQDFAKSHLYELNDFYQALKQTESQLNIIQKKIEEKLSDVASLIFTAQILMLKDKFFIDSMVEKIEAGVNPIEAIICVVETYIEKFGNLQNEYLKERSQDIKDVGTRILGNLIGHKANVLDYTDRIVIANELFASDILKLYSQKVRGVVLLTGGVTSHLSILASSLQIPLIIVDEPDILRLDQNTTILIDGELGNVYINPSSEILDTFEKKEEAARLSEKVAMSVLSETRSADNAKVVLLANINLLGDLQHAHDFKAEGVGLYRTEFPFIVRSDFPSEEEQYAIYKQLIERMQGKEVTFRTLDIGGDKALSYFDHHAKEANPFLGLRSIRFSLQHKEIFQQQLKAILRAGFNADIKIMFPMVSSIDEFLEAKDLLNQCIALLVSKKIDCNQNPKIGLMIELPSVLEVIDELAGVADFFSIGTNDFIQYMLAVDRTNEKVANLYLPYHPAVLRGLNKVVQAALHHNKEISICGEMVQDEKYLKFLLGIGIRKLSLNPNFIPRIQKNIMKINMTQAQTYACQLLKESTLRGVRQII